MKTSSASVLPPMLCFGLWLLCTGAIAASVVQLSDASLRNLTESYRLPSIAYSVAHRGEIIDVRAFGTRRFGYDIPVSVDDKWAIGSCTKAFTSLLFATIVQNASLGVSWTTKLSQVFPEWNLPADVGSITIDQLATHTSGIPPETDDFYLNLYKTESVELGYLGDLDEIRYKWVQPMLMSMKLASTPGAKFAYSNRGIIVLGAVVEKVYNRTFEELTQERVFAPLGLKRAGFGCPASLGLVDAPLPHMLSKGKLVSYLAGPNCNPISKVVIGPAGSAHMTVKDFALWASWHAARGRRAPFIVSPDSIDYLHTGAKNISAIMGFTPARGWFIGRVPSVYPRTVLYHTGNTGLLFATAMVDTEADLALVATANASPEDVDAAHLELFRQWAKANPDIVLRGSASARSPLITCFVSLILLTFAASF